MRISAKTVAVVRIVAIATIGVALNRACPTFAQTQPKPYRVGMLYPEFDDFWQKMTIRKTPAVKTVLALPKAELPRLMDAVRAEVTLPADGNILCTARANGIKAHVPR